ncbi:hypothetical protein SB49_14130 [Sediminicola sp. YIK13]|uniref:RHS repeat domain-containing protein n=1 Tax=Sediminicola sp. YIK13 TaxID=1453352 RepID=UPI000722CF25|nr:RHS repeat-associated core domain-containing protein [Sediminicola sp. YIK13]ALM08806.1 hypothetical protein SB49_14130 [Sediminicola sp. YIK13]
MKNLRKIVTLFILLITNGIVAQTVTDTDKNLVYSAVYDINGAKKGAGVSYFDLLGKATQTQSWDLKTNKIWTTQVLYDSEGRPALNTLSAPIGSGNFQFKPDFIKNSSGAAYNSFDFESVPNSPSAVGSQLNSLGWYYSNSNTSESYQDVTSYPFSRTIYSKLIPGAVLKTVGGNKINGEWPQAYTFSMQASKELSQSVAFGDVKYDNYKIMKVVNRDVHGVENVMFMDTDGKTLASARCGGTISRTMSLKIGEQGYADIHVPSGSNMGFTVSTGGYAITTYNLITETTVSPSTGLPYGFYRVSVNNPDSYIKNSITVTYKENYYDYALNEYDEIGRLVASYQPLNKLKTEYQYNTLGQLVYTKSPDEGEAWFKYRRDGQIRYSQNSKQVLLNEVSYTNYDSYARPIESGVLSVSNFSSLNPETALPAGTKKEQQLTTYDALSTTELNTLPSNYRTPSFLAGNVAKTSNDQTTTYYSYDIYGRVKWMVQNINGLGFKTIDYVYDVVSGQVTTVDYQKSIAAERFIHRYTYNSQDNNLIKVETSTNGSAYTTHAEYNYYETGALKRTALAGGIQGIDYVYNLSGQLKSINHPSLSASNDPGGDTNDIFGMNMHYNSNDYSRTNTPKPIPSTNNGLDQLNGNIKAITWGTQNLGTSNPDTYYYKYNRNNWLEGASFNQSLEVDPSILAAETRQATVTSSETVEATQSIVLKNGFYVKGTSSLTFTAKINAGDNVNGNLDYNVSNITYDANGNIKSLKRNKNMASGSNAMDNLSYVYKTDKPNQLLRVDDAIGQVSGAEDIEDQNGDNYMYNAIGQMTNDVSEGILYEYNTSGLVTKVSKNNVTLITFFYNDKGYRVKKTSHNTTNGNVLFTEHYVRDASGNPIAIYYNGAVKEHAVYGANRHGVFNRTDASTTYELTDHLGNVRAVFKNGNANAIAATDYYPFGMSMPNRNILGDYRYAFQGQEKDKETGKEAFQLRLWDSRIGRWLTTDPAGQYSSPYLGMGNDPINSVDPDGGWKWKIFANWARNSAINAGLDPGELYKINGEWGFNTGSGGEVFNTRAGGLQFETSVAFNYTSAWKNSIPAQIAPLTGINYFQMWRQASPENNWDAIKHIGTELTFGTFDNIKVLLTGSHFGNGPWLKGSIPNNSDSGVEGLVSVATLGYSSTYTKGLKVMKSNPFGWNSFSKVTKGWFKGPNHATLRSKAYQELMRQHNLKSYNNNAVKQFNEFKSELDRVMQTIIQDNKQQD